MQPFSNFSPGTKKKIRYVLTDIDDTLTLNGRLPSVVVYGHGSVGGGKN